MKILLTCEHAGNEIPTELQYLFSENREVLKTHRAYDPGAYDLFLQLLSLSNYSNFYLTSRLLVEPNRSIGHPQLFSEFSKRLSASEKAEILQRFYFPYRNSVEKKVAGVLEKGEKLLHLSIHSFTPVLQGEIRNADIGLLYDPQRNFEKSFCKIFKIYIKEVSPEIKVRFNYPYLGTADGFTTYLRKKYAENYAGIEIEVNQKYVKDTFMAEEIKTTLFQALQNSVEQWEQ